MIPASRSGAWTTKSSSSPTSRGNGAGRLLGHGDEDVGRRGVGPALEQAGQEQVPLLPAHEILVLVGGLAARAAASGT